MKMQPGFDELFAGIDASIAAKEYDGARARLDALHIEYHDAPFVHLRIHVLQLQIARRQRSVRGVVGQILPVLFAVPVSYVQRYWGLALPSRMRNKGG